LLASLNFNDDIKAFTAARIVAMRLMQSQKALMQRLFYFNELHFDIDFSSICCEWLAGKGACVVR
jgi:hypothetical protein